MSQEVWVALPIVADVEQPLGFWPAREQTAIIWLCGSMQEYGFPRLSERDRPAYSDVTRRVHPLYIVSGVFDCLYQVDF